MQCLKLSKFPHRQIQTLNRPTLYDRYPHLQIHNSYRVTLCGPNPQIMISQVLAKAGVNEEPLQIRNVVYLVWRA